MCKVGSLIYLVAFLNCFIPRVLLVNEARKVFIEIVYIIYEISCKRNQGEEAGGGVLMAFLLDFMGLHPHPSAYQQSIYSKRKKEKLHPV